jgi:hypothetical protein
MPEAFSNLWAMSGLGLRTLMMAYMEAAVATARRRWREYFMRHTARTCNKLYLISTTPSNTNLAENLRRREPRSEIMGTVTTTC